jgi:putative acetyltransferase
VIRIRPARQEDAAAMAAVYRRAVEISGARDYAPAQVAVWRDQGPDAAGMARRLGDGRRTWAAVDEVDAVLGFVDLEPDGHIDLLYVDPDAAGRGVAGALLDVLEAEASAAGLKRLYVEASETARPVLLKRSFVELGRRDLVIAGTPIHNYAMAKSL